MRRVGRVLASMMAKDLRMLLRERSQMAGIAVALAFTFALPFVILSQLPASHGHAPGVQAQAPGDVAGGGAGPAPPPTVGEREALPESSGREATAGEGEPGAATEDTLRALEVRARWLIVGAVGMLSLLLTFLFGIAIALAAFVGEREARTAELLLAAPFSRARLYLLKVLSVLGINLGIVYAVLGVLALMAALAASAWGPELTAGTRPGGEGVPPELLRETLLGILAALPVPLVVVTLVVGLGTLSSAGAETTKGAGQLFGLGTMVMMFGFWMAPLLLPAAAIAFLQGVGQRFGALGFGAQYGILMASVTALALALLLAGYLLFDRERMLR